MPDNYGPTLVDFSPLSKLADTFFDARDKAIDRQFKQAQLAAPGAIAQYQAQGLNDGSSLIPNSAGTPGTPGMVPLGSIGARSVSDLANPQAMKPQTFDPSTVPSFVTAAAGQAGVSPDYMAKTAWIESKLNPNAFNQGSGASGLYQFIPSTWRQYGGNGSPFNPQANAVAMAALTADNKAALQRSLGRDPTDAELYLAHQQGAGGASALLSNPNAPAVQALAGIYARSGAKDPYGTAIKAVVGNGGRPDMTAGEFASMWTSKYNALSPAGGSPQMGGSPQIAQAMGQRTMTMPGYGVQTAQTPNMDPNGTQTARTPGLNPNGTLQSSSPSRMAQTGVGATPAPMVGLGQPNMTMPAGTQDAASPADVPAPGAQPAQYRIPGQDTGQNTAASAAQVTAPRIQIPSYIQAAVRDPNPYVQIWARNQIAEYQKIQRQLDVEAWKLQAGHDLDQPNKDRTYNLQRDQFGHTVENDDRNYGLNVDKFGHEKDKDAQDLALRGRQVTAQEGTLGVAQTNAQTNRDRLTHQTEQDNASNAFRNREVTTQEEAQKLRVRQQDFNEGQQINGPIDKQIIEDLDKGRAQALGAADTLKDLDRQEANVNKGMFMGAGADRMQAVSRYLTGIFPSLNDAVSAGQDYQAAVQREVGSLARQLAQTGHTTNMDINVSKMISAADPEYTEQAIREIIRQNRIRAQDVIARHNATVDDYASRNPAAANRAGFFKVNPPQAPDDAVTAEKNANTGANLGPLPKGEDRVPIPRGYTATGVVAEAMKAYKQAGQEQDPAIRQQKQNAILKRVHSFGIDPSRIAN